MLYHNIKFSDKENALKQTQVNNSKSNALTTKSRNIPSNSENAFNIRSNAKQINQNAGNRGPIARVPLGGKDQNKAVPSLLRSQSSLNAGDNKQQRKKILLPKAPSLSKANSSLGFVHRSNLSTSEGSYKPQQNKKLANINKSIFNPDNAQRSQELVQPQDTDSLTKNITDAPTTPVGSPSLPSTITPKTQLLDASNISHRDLNRNNVDPIKRNIKKSNKINEQNKQADIKKSFQIHQDLIEDEESIEYVPVKGPSIPYKPSDMDSLTETDLELFSKPNGITLTEQNEHEYPEIYKNEMDLNFQEINLDDPKNFSFEYDDQDIEADDKVDEDTKNIGLNVDELNDLLDF